MSAHFSSHTSQPASHWGSCQEGCYTQNPPNRFQKRSIALHPAPGHHLRSCAPNTTDLPEAGHPGCTRHEGERAENRLISRRLEIVPITLFEPRTECCRHTCLRTHRLTPSGNTKEVDGQAKSGIVGRSNVPGQVGNLGFSLTSEGSDFTWVLNNGEHLGLPGEQARDGRTGTEMRCSCPLDEEKQKKEGFIYFSCVQTA